MSRELFGRNADLKRLRDEGYFVQVRGGLLSMREVPYVDAQRRRATGTLVSSLNMSGDVTRRPDTHQVWWDGDFPCFAEGTPINAIGSNSGNFDLGHGVTAKFHFSSKPDGGYTDYYHKMSTYAGVISGQAAVLQPCARRESSVSRRTKATGSSTTSTPPPTGRGSAPERAARRRDRGNRGPRGERFVRAGPGG